ncbi:OmpA family protein [Acidithiobacillus sp. IBUN Pt1247-S3]|uniref:OmpA family protein n=1 Tax=Acidithiobacillus sp. IBUN Pt1247-S3 TaxID=3166642 RepID=UPI0034E41468
MRLERAVILSAVLIAAAGCANGPFLGCPAGKPPVAKPAPIPTPAPAPAPIAPVQKTVLESKPITITGINFKINSYKLLSHDIHVLDEVAAFSEKHPDAVLDVNGYCSKVGTYAYNLKLSKLRAASVAKYLEAHGVAKDRMVLKGHSFDDPVASNATPEGRFQNQRVEINSTIKVQKTVTE